MKVFIAPLLLLTLASCKTVNDSSLDQETPLDKLLKGSEKYYESDALASKYDAFYSGCDKGKTAGFCKAKVYTFNPAQYEPVNDTKRNTAVKVEVVAVPAMYKRKDGRAAYAKTCSLSACQALAQDYLNKGIRQKIKNRDPYYTYPALAVYWEFDDWGSNSRELKCAGIFYDVKSQAQEKKGYYDVADNQKKYRELIEKMSGTKCFERNF